LFDALVETLTANLGYIFTACLAVPARLHALSGTDHFLWTQPAPKSQRVLSSSSTRLSSVLSLIVLLGSRHHACMFALGVLRNLVQICRIWKLHRCVRDKTNNTQ